MSCFTDFTYFTEKGIAMTTNEPTLPGMETAEIKPALDRYDIKPDKLVIEANYDDSGCYALSVRMNHDGIMREDILETIAALFHPGQYPMPIPRPSRIRPAVPVVPVPNYPAPFREQNPMRIRPTNLGEALTEIIPVQRNGSPTA